MRGLVDELRRRRLVQTASSLDEAPPETVASGLPALDRVCGGGLPRGRLSELCTGASAGAALLHALLLAAGDRGELCALVDAGDGFEPRSARAAGVALARVLWVRPPGPREALRAAELLLETGGFGLVALDWGRAKPTAPAAAWLRLARLARAGGALLVSLAPGPSAGVFAGLSIEVTRFRPRWREAGGGGGPRWLAGFELDFALRRRRGGPGAAGEARRG
ncbi:MAG TPA: hypothetical protein PK668_22270 [Myxococcota bacterium]|nr:hypothetical protein [Myxococcota bacterium]HRY96297.1 hypothetical protein [Myxococcota bacterium]HSA24188.1 hypothetical protein [Myxococcota bacterium]